MTIYDDAMADNPRTSDASLLNPVFLNRWSNRSFTDQPVTDDQIAAVFEAARWAPSWMNKQPWYFVYETDGPDRQAILDTFMEFNREWASAAPLVGLCIAKTELEGFMGRSRDFDAGAAMFSLTLQAHMMGLAVHVLGGIEIDAAHELTGADPDDSKIICGFVVGHPGPVDALPEGLQEKEQPSPRKPVSEFAFKGGKLPADF